MKTKVVHKTHKAFIDATGTQVKLCDFNSTEDELKCSWKDVTCKRCQFWRWPLQSRWKMKALGVKVFKKIILPAHPELGIEEEIEYVEVKP